MSPPVVRQDDAPVEPAIPVLVVPGVQLLRAVARMMAEGILAGVFVVAAFVAGVAFGVWVRSERGGKPR